MVEVGEDVVILDAAVALSRGSVQVGQDAVLYSERLARGDSTPQVGQDAVLSTGTLAQGPGGYSLNEEKLKVSDTLVAKGDTVTLSINVVNSTERDVSQYEMTFKEDGSAIETQTADIPAGSEHTYTLDVTKTDVGSFTYQANSSNTVDVAWMNVRPGDLDASDHGVALHQGEETTTLSIPVENVSSSDVEVRVDFREDDTNFERQTVTISANSSYTFSVDRTYTSVQEHSYDAFVVETATSVAALSNSIGVKWYDETTAWDNIIVPTVVANTTNEICSEANTTEFSAGAEKTQDGFLAEPEGEDGVITIEWEDKQSLPRDEQVIYDNSNWENGGYVRIEINHDSSACEHENWVGTQADGHYLGSHFEPGGTADGEFDELTVFQGRAYDDGTLTDLNGNQIGTWK